MQWVRVRVRVRVRVSVSFAFSEAFCRNSGCRNSGLYPNVPNSMRPGFAQAYQHCFFFGPIIPNSMVSGTQMMHFFRSFQVQYCKRNLIAQIQVVATELTTPVNVLKILKITPVAKVIYYIAWCIWIVTFQGTR